MGMSDGMGEGHEQSQGLACDCLLVSRHHLRHAGPVVMEALSLKEAEMEAH